MFCVQAELSKEQFEAARAAFKAEGEGQSRIGLHSVQRALLRYGILRYSRIVQCSPLSKRVHSWDPPGGKLVSSLPFGYFDSKHLSNLKKILVLSVCLSVCVSLDIRRAACVTPGIFSVERLLSLLAPLNKPRLAVDSAVITY